MTNDEFNSLDRNKYLAANGYSVAYTSKLQDVRREKEIVKQWITLQEKYPLKRKMGHLEIKDFKDSKGKIQSDVYAHYKSIKKVSKNVDIGQDEHIIELNLQLYKTKSKLEMYYNNDVKRGFHPQNTKVDAVLTHEYGHALHLDMKYDFQKHMGESVNALKENDPTAYASYGHSNAINKMYKDNIISINSKVSKYAAKNDLEFFAESFCQMEHVGKNTNMYTDFVHEVINDYD